MPRNTGKMIGRNVFLIILAMLSAFVLGRMLREDMPASGMQDEHVHAGQPEKWTCSMHPQVLLPKPGQCPICFMDLIPLEEGGDSSMDVAALELSEAAAALADIATATVSRHLPEMNLRLLGKVEVDQERMRTLTARFAGRLEKMYVGSTGQPIRPGEPLAEIYSPELYRTQSELISSLEDLDRVHGGSPPLESGALALVNSVRERLRLWGMSEAQIDRIQDRREISENFKIHAPIGGIVLSKDAKEGDYLRLGSPLLSLADLSSVWVVLQAYESDLAWLREGQEVEIAVASRPGDRFTGKIQFIDPLLDDRTRTVDIRIPMDNSAGWLKPGMLVTSRVTVHPTSAGITAPATTSSRRPPLVVPASAVLRTGKRAIVYLRDPSSSQPRFLGREIVLGPRAGDEYIVAEGLEEGDEVVVRGNFKIDSALQIQALPSMMNPRKEDEAPARDLPGAIALSPVPGLSESLHPVVRLYLDLQEALAGDDDTAGRDIAGALKDQLASLEISRSRDMDGQRIHDAFQRLKDNADRIHLAADIQHRRSAFQPLSDELWPMLDQLAYRGESPLRQFHCPMAFDGKGADWIQASSETANPYYGASMLRCGSEVAVLGGGK